jgi:diguanylate cyclase (GGDEF)-like protein
LDCFKSFNEQYGYLTGDKSIKAITQVFRQTIRRLSDVLARFSDERFIALLPATQAEGAVHLAELVRSGVEKLGIPHSKSEVAGHLTISLGVASAIPMRGANVEALLTLSEHCLSRSKELGRNRFHVAHLPEEG